MGEEKTQITHVEWSPGNKTTPNPPFSLPEPAVVMAALGGGAGEGATGRWNCLTSHLCS